MFRNGWWAVIALGLTACGGGGGGKDGGGQPTGPSGPKGSVTVPQSPPALPGITYQGAEGPADPSTTNAGALAEAMRGAVQLSMDFADDIVTLPLAAGETIDETQSGPGGGTMRLTGRAQADGTGWLLVTYTDYREGTGSVNGRQLLESLQVASPANGLITQFRLSFADFRVQELNDFDATYNGALTRSDTGNTSERTVTGSLYIRDNLLNRSFYAQNVNLTRAPTNFGGYLALSGSARVYDSRHGYLDVQSEAPWYLSYGEEYPHHGGALRGVGLGGRHVRLEPLTTTTAAIEFVAANATQPNYSVRLNWSDDFEEQTTRQPLERPLADGGSSLSDLPGRVVSLDSRFSSHRQNAFVSSQWQLLFRPPGSNAQLDAPAATQPKITMDLPGRYVLQLEVSDGVRTDRDVIALTANPNQSTLYQPVKSQLTADEVSSSASLWFDLGRTQYTNSEYPQPQLVLSSSGPYGYDAQITQTGQSATALLSRSGVYQFVWSLGGPSASDQLIRDVKWVAFGTQMPFAPAGTGYLGADGALATGPASGDLNGDGFIDLLVTSSDANGARVQVFYNNAQGLLSAPVAIPIEQMNTAAIADVTSDGIADIVLRHNNGIAVIPQTTLGVFGPQQLIAGGCSSADPQLAIADLNGDSRLDAVTFGCGGGGLTYFLQSGSGQLQPGVAVATGTSAQVQFAVGDLNGDAIADVALNDRSYTTAPNVFALYGVRDALPGAPVALPFQAAQTQRSGGPIAIGDLNGDGRGDIVAADVPMLSNFAPRVQIFLRQADGTYAVPSALDAGQILTRMRVSDMNNDGRNDIVIGIGAVGLTVAYNNGPGGFTQFAPDLRPTIGESGPAYPQTVADFNGDGRVDFAYVTQQRYRPVLAVALGVAE